MVTAVPTVALQVTVLSDGTSREDFASSNEIQRKSGPLQFSISSDR